MFRNQDGLTPAPPPAEHPVCRTLHQFFHRYLTLRDMQGALSMLSDQFYSVGTGESEVAIGKPAFLPLLREELAQFPSPIDFTMTDYVQKERVPGCWDCFCHMEVCFPLSGGPQALYHMRVTAGLHGVEGGYLIDTIHASVASKYQEKGEFLPLKFMAQETPPLDRETQYQLMELIGQIMPGGILGGYLEEGFPLYVANNRLLVMGGYKNYQDFSDDIHGLIINSIHPEDRNYVRAQIANALSDQYEIKYRMKRKDGSYIWVHGIGRKTISACGRDATISILIDISQQMSAQSRLEHEAISDPLTGIYNRKGGQERITQALGSASSYVFLMMDLDHFKRVNDFYGHQEGDRVLCLVAELLLKYFRKSDVVCRMGGDEFAVFVADCDDAAVMEHKLHALLHSYKSMMTSGWPLAGSTLSVGGVCGHRERTCPELYELADEVLYEVKNSRKGTYKLRILD